MNLLQHVFIVSAYHDAFDLIGVGVEGEAEEVFETCAVERAAHTDDAVLG